MLPPVLRIEPELARRFVLSATRLDAPLPDVGRAVSHLGCVQIDPINVCGRVHDLILRHRVTGYREGDLMRHLHGEGAPLPPEGRVAFEHHFAADGRAAGILAAFPLAAWPHLVGAMRARARRAGAWSGRLTRVQRVMAERIFAELAARGPLASEDFTEAGRTRSVWGAATLVKATMQKLFFHGRLLIARRGESNRRCYDLPERVLPAAVLGAPVPPEPETARWSVVLKLRQRRLVLLKRGEVPLVADLVQPVAVAGCPLLYCLREDVGIFENLRASPPPPAAPRLLAPLDPAVYDRRVTARLWGFPYVWEAYTPPARRVRGYYALPILAGAELVGHVDPKADRPAGRLRIMSRRAPRGLAVAPAVRELATFLGLRP